MTRIVNITLGNPRRDERGRSGVAVHLHVEHGGWDGHYSFTTHRMLPESVAAEKDRFLARHQRKAEKLTAFSTLIGASPAKGWTITDATIRDRGHGCELLCRANSASGERLEWVEFFDDPSRAPTAAEVLDGMRARADAHFDHHVESGEHAAEVRAALGLALE